MNFWSHADEEANTIMLAYGSKEKIEILIADNAIGIVNNLRKVEKYSKKSDETLLLSSLKRGVTSKPDGNHMGCGLYLINKLVEANNGRLTIFSNNVYLEQDKAKVKVLPSPNWKGTILRLVLSLKEPKTIEDMDCFDYNHNIQINWG
jgi:hypothetical protein